MDYDNFAGKQLAIGNHVYSVERCFDARIFGTKGKSQNKIVVIAQKQDQQGRRLDVIQDYLDGDEPSEAALRAMIRNKWPT